MLLTESARLDIYKKGSDSLMGRYVPTGFIHLSTCACCWGCVKSPKNSFGYQPYRLQEVILNRTNSFYTAPKAVANFNHNLYDDLGRMQEANTLDKRRIRKASSKSSITDVIFLVICLKSICLIDPTPSARQVWRLEFSLLSAHPPECVQA